MPSCVWTLSRLFLKTSYRCSIIYNLLQPDAYPLCVLNCSDSVAREIPRSLLLTQPGSDGDVLAYVSYLLPDSEYYGKSTPRLRKQDMARISVQRIYSFVASLQLTCLLSGAPIKGMTKLHAEYYTQKRSQYLFASDFLVMS